MLGSYRQKKTLVLIEICNKRSIVERMGELRFLKTTTLATISKCAENVQPHEIIIQKWGHFQSLKVPGSKKKAAL